MPKPIMYNNIKEYIEGKNGNRCKLITSESEFNKEKIIQNKVGSHIKIKILCQCGNQFTTTFNNFKNPHIKKNTCELCSKKRMKEKQKFSYETIKKYIESNSDCILLSKDYTNNRTKLHLQCSCGNKFKVRLDKFKSGQIYCNECSKKRNAKKYTKTTKQYKFNKNTLLEV